VTRLVAIDVPQARVFALEAGSEGRGTLLAGPPHTAGMRSGVVVLPPGGAVGHHSTGAREEMIVVLGGEGEVRLDAGAPLVIGAGRGAYIPPGTGHDVVNRGAAPLRYVYVVAPAPGHEAVR
jgi:mannose-6-phosphate isomerase-like protein (cupin superfamily)